MSFAPAHLFTAIVILLTSLAMLSASQAAHSQTVILGADHTSLDLYDKMANVRVENFDLRNPNHVARSLAESPAPDMLRGTYYEANQWTVASLENGTGVPKVVRFRVMKYGLKGFSLYVRRGDVIEILMDYPDTSLPLAERPVFDQIPTSGSVRLAPGEIIDVWAFASQGFLGSWANADVLQVIDEETYDFRRKWSWFGHAAYFGAAISLIIFFVIFSVLLKSKAAAFYGLFFFGLFATSANLTGFGFVFLHPDQPLLDEYLLRPLQLGTIIAHFLFVASFLRAAKEYPAYFNALLTLGLFGVFAVFWGIFLWSPVFETAINVYGLLFIVAGAWAAFVALRDGIKGASLFGIGIGILFCYIALGTASNYKDDGIFERGMVSILTYSGQILDGVVFAAAIVRQTFALRHERDLALRSELSASQARVEAIEARACAERDRDRARQLADHQRKHLESTSHDLLQPLTSLQIALQEGDLNSPDTKEKLATGLDYLNTVLGETLEGIREGDAHLNQIEQITEPVPVQVVFDNLSRMFAAEADKQRLNLKFRPSAAILQTDTIGLVRALSNLVSNALKYTSDGDILVAARRRDGAVQIAVYDTGAGLEPTALARVLEKGQRDAPDGDVSGTGLGLAIVAEWAEKNGLSFDAKSQPGRGSVFFIGGFGQV
ncbi:MAG: sensor histidine kinase [Pseudomonadota bacterium]